MYIPNSKTLIEREKESNKSKDIVHHISAARREQLATFGSNDPRILEVEKKYGKYLFVPLALPVFELPNQEHFLSWWKDHMHVTKKLDGDAVMLGYGIDPFETVDLITEIGNQWWEKNNKGEEFQKEFPQLWQQFNDNLPCTKLLRLTLWSSRYEIQEHRDSAEMVDMPISFRMKLYDENPEETLYLLDNPMQPYTCGEPHMLPRAPNTNSFVWNNLRVKHGSVFNPNHRKILAFAFGLVDFERYTQLIETSINTYRDYCITSNNSIENYVNI
jgi:predicted transcriptional regulator YdeE